MCGLFGSFSKLLAEDTIKKCSLIMQHRGPDDNYHISHPDSNFTVAAVRLALNDESINGRSQ